MPLSPISRRLASKFSDLNLMIHIQKNGGQQQRQPKAVVGSVLDFAIYAQSWIAPLRFEM
jgi:hypothetical protein